MNIKRDKTITALLIITAFLYAAFLYMDLCSIYSSISNALKYSSVLLCLTMALLSYREPYNLKDCRLIITALTFTALADYFLLFTTKTTIGVVVFCMAHLAHIARFNKYAFKTCAILYLFSIAVLSAFTALDINLPYLYIVSSLYAILLLTATIMVFRTDIPKQNQLLVRTGMMLFVLCDICVALFNVLPAGSIVHRAALLLIWFFYVPSQVSLALSAREF